jgi:signal transduction histidine kinase
MEPRPAADHVFVVHVHLKDALRIAALAAAYVAAARFGLLFDPVAGFATFVWPPTGIAIAALLIFGSRLWPGILIGAAIANALTGAPLAVAAGIGIGNTLEAVAGVYLLRRVPGFTRSLETLGTVFGLILGVATVCTAISATIGVASLFLGHIVLAPALRETWQAWWVGDLIGAVVFAPIILVWSTPPRVRIDHRPAETALLAIAVVAVSLVSFFGDLPGIPTLPTPFDQAALTLAIVIWAALRFGQRGAITATFCMSKLAVLATVTHHGPFAVADAHTSMLSLQTSMAIVSITCLLLGAALAERRWALERARQAQADAERANRAKMAFMNVMSHELRTPLNAIAGYSQLLCGGDFGALNPKQTDALDHIQRSERELLGQINAVLTFVRLESGEHALHPERVTVVDAFDAVEPTIAPEVRRKHFVMQRELPKIPLSVRADRKGLHQLLASLVSNASKYTKDGGVITFGAERMDGRVRIWVRDTGVGISHEKLDQVFEPFFQAEQGNTRRFEGVGLGLAIARDLARGMDGELNIASEEGTGTTASVMLPVA